VAGTIVASPSSATTVPAVGPESRVGPIAAISSVLVRALMSAHVAHAAAILRVAGEALLSRMLRWGRQSTLLPWKIVDRRPRAPALHRGTWARRFAGVLISRMSPMLLSLSKTRSRATKRVGNAAECRATRCGLWRLRRLSRPSSPKRCLTGKRVRIGRR